ncbi:bifunctional MaoC family dehydratase N-terminal/OB-fold nucleic acid binding domain-containing protein [Nocardioides sp. B-3]|uniref:bifunctional MaoC family dehydratase N-terminal/OB-fold nucleic acid binding domain-containing protein n=1 Tax=Nocardioides sp. B-3 TaxID=2895565 RepID=UPI002152C1B3|nr:OB-fold domain-containing protein [Nocardioides sp. B-3]UUZ59397.1 OB-fold domain-containing protein [Nocardioides sp. B-3]
MSAYDDALAAFVGRSLVALRPAADPVNVPMIRHWVEAMGDSNPRYLAGDGVAPASMMQARTMRGFGATVTAGGFDELVALLAEGGYTSVVATDSDLELVREVVPGDHLSVEEVVESISPEKTTGSGVGRFVTTLKTYRDAAGEVVATQRWRTLRFRPSPALEPRPRPAINLDNAFWFEAAREHRLVVQRCLGCKTLRHPPGPACPECQSFDWDTVEARGRGTLYSFVVAHHPRHPAFDYPLLIAVVELEEGTRLITNLTGVTADDLTIGMPLEVEWLDADPELTLPVFRPLVSREN